jgi:hypothetical protein
VREDPSARASQPIARRRARKAKEPARHRSRRGSHGKLHRPRVFPGVSPLVSALFSAPGGTAGGSWIAYDRSKNEIRHINQHQRSDMWFWRDFGADTRDPAPACNIAQLLRVASEETLTCSRGWRGESTGTSPSSWIVNGSSVVALDGRVSEWQAAPVLMSSPQQVVQKATRAERSCCDRPSRSIASLWRRAGLAFSAVRLHTLLPA